MVKIDSLLAGVTESAEQPDEIIERLKEIREELRQAKQWQMADMIRQRLIDLGIALEDTPKRTIWKRIL
jgi:cysteinyl-tRNA synthetase